MTTTRRYTYFGGQGGRIVPGVGGAGNAGGAGGSGGNAGETNTSYSGGGGGWGAYGGNGRNGLGAAGGSAVVLNGSTVTWDGDFAANFATKVLGDVS